MTTYTRTRNRIRLLLDGIPPKSTPRTRAIWFAAFRCGVPLQPRHSAPIRLDPGDMRGMPTFERMAP